MRQLLALALLLFVIGFDAHAGSIRDIGVNVTGLFMNDAGVVAGLRPGPPPASPYETSAPIAFVDRNGAVTDLGTDVVPVHVAADGRVIDGGLAMTGPASNPLFLNVDGEYLSITRPNSGNERGQIIGAVSYTAQNRWTNYSTMQEHPQYQAGYVVTMPTSSAIPDGPFRTSLATSVGTVQAPITGGTVKEVYPLAINNSGVIGGGAMVEYDVQRDGKTLSLFGTHAFVGNQDLTPLMKDAFGQIPNTAEVFAINDKGDAAGLAGSDLRYGGMPFLFRNGSLIWLPNPVETRDGFTAQWQALRAMNEKDQVVGQDLYNNGYGYGFHAILFDPDRGTTIDLNSLLPKGSGWVLTDAVGINNNGQVLGYGLLDGQMHGYVLDLNGDSIQPAPIPEPATWAAFAVLGVLAAVRPCSRRAAA
jgi:hypothetical protein